ASGDAPTCAVPASLLKDDESLTSVAPSTRQNFSASSDSTRLHWGQRFIVNVRQTSVCRLRYSLPSVSDKLKFVGHSYSGRFSRLTISLNRGSARSGSQYRSAFMRNNSQSCASKALRSSSKALSRSPRAA